MNIKNQFIFLIMYVEKIIGWIKASNLIIHTSLSFFIVLMTIGNIQYSHGVVDEVAKDYKYIKNSNAQLIDKFFIETRESKDYNYNYTIQYYVEQITDLLESENDKVENFEKLKSELRNFLNSEEIKGYWSG